MCLLGACQTGTLENGAAPAGDGGATVAVAAQALTAAPLGAAADTTLRAAIPFGNDGTGTLLGVTSASVANIERSIVRFDQSEIAARIPAGNVLHRARLDLHIAGISAGWLGGAVDVLPMNRGWVEGTGLAGNGASWVCANDTNTTFFGNFTNDCAAADNWSMLPGGPYPQPFATLATDRKRIFTGGLTTISFDVTRDVQSYLNGAATNHGWMLAGAPNLQGGLWVNFGSRNHSNAALRPQLIIEYGPDECPMNPDKGLPGVCGCDLPDVDTDLDGAPDCFDAVVTATADNTLRLAVPFGNDGTGTLLGTTSASIVDLERSLVQVSNEAIEAARGGRAIKRAYLELTVAGVAVGWLGGQLEVNRMLRPWAEGNGLAGHGSSWFCADDTNTTLSGLYVNNCTIADSWGMQLFDPFPRPFSATPTASVNLTWPPITTARFDVTEDVKRFVADPIGAVYPNHGWIVQGAATWIGGNWVNFGSRETGAPPRLLLDLDPECPPGLDGDADNDGVLDCNDECDDDPAKSTAGQCGCGNPDVDPDADGIASCIDPCPLDDDPTLGGDCGCPSTTFEDEGTPCVGACPNGPGGFATCDGAGHCGEIGDSSTCPPPVDGCPACQPVVTTETVYWYCPCGRSGTDARDSCEEQGLALPVILTEDTNTAISSQITADTWLAASDLGGEGDWRWSDDANGILYWEGDESGAPSAGLYTSWAAGQPSDSAADLDCGAIAPNGEWSARACTDNLHVLCVKSLTTIPNPPRGGKPPEICEIMGNCADNSGPCIDPATVPNAYPGICPSGDPDEYCPEQDAARQQLEACDTCMANNPSACGASGTEAQCRAACDGLCVGAATDTPSGGTPCTDFDDIFDPDVEQHCTLQFPLTNRPCDSHDDCSDLPEAFRHCGRAFYCQVGQTPNFNQPCTPFHDSEVAGPSRTEICTGSDDECVAHLFCGAPVDTCFLEDDDPELCVEYDLCIDPADEHTPDEPSPAEITELTTPTTFVPADAFEDEDLPTTDLDAFPEDGPCPDGGYACTVPPLGEMHPWCKYELTEALDERNASDSDKHGTAGPSGPVSFTFDPNLTLTYRMSNGPLGLPLPYVGAEASAKASAEINIFDVNTGIQILDVGLGAHAGFNGELRPGNGPKTGPDDLCGIRTDSRAKILSLDILPVDNDANITLPDPEIQEECVEAVQAFTEKVDRVRKAFSDARELIRQYNELKANGLNFSDGSGAVESLCEQIAANPPRDFPAPIFGIPCETEPPELTIDRFIYYYNVTVRDALYAEAQALAQKLNAWGTSIEPIALVGVNEYEEVTIFNQTFLVGPVPVNLEVLLPVTYGFGMTVRPQFALGDVVLQLVFGGQRSLSKPFVQVAIDGGPTAGAGITLFAGVGFDVGFASAKFGVEGAINLGTIVVPANAWAGLGMVGEPDDRDLPASWADLVDTDVTTLVPTQKLSFALLYGYGARLDLFDVLSGSISARLKLKFFWFSVSYRKRIIQFNGFCTEDVGDTNRKEWCSVELFRSGPDDLWKWGTLQLPVPFAPLKYLPIENGRPATGEFSSALVNELFYDSLCQCLPNWDGQIPEEDCHRDEDCCSNQCIQLTSGPAAGHKVCTVPVE